MMKIMETNDAELLAVLNRDVQEIHAEIEPGIFKKYSKEGMQKLFEEALKNENTKGFVAYYDGKPVGYALVSKRDIPETYFKYPYSVVYIEQICIDRKYIRKNAGKELVNHVKSYAESLGVKRIELDFWCKNENAGQFFRSQGFSTFNKRMCYVKNI
ncbi:MAG TPA: GNAT family N-acetyltransferase [Clostridia bacterium]